MSLQDDGRWAMAKTRAARLRWAREANDLSQDETAKRAQLPRRDKKGEVMGRAGYRLYELEAADGGRDLPHEFAVTLARKLGVRLAWLYDGESPPFGEVDQPDSVVADEVRQLVADADPDFQVEVLEQVRFMMARRAGVKS